MNKRILGQYNYFIDLPYDKCFIALEANNDEYTVKAYTEKHCFIVAKYKNRKNADEAIEDMMEWAQKPINVYYKFPESVEE